MAILGTFMVPHPPLIVKEVGGEEIEKIRTTRDSYMEIAKKIGELKPDTIIVSSPHAPFYSDYFYLPDGEEGYGSFERFGAKQVSFNEKYDVSLIDEIERIAKERDFPCGRIKKEIELDHGTMVPLYFINKYISDYKLVVVGLSDISLEANYEMGKIIREAVNNLNRRVVYVASGDLSHKLKEYGPYGFIKEGPIYDERIMDVMKNARFEELLKFDLDFLEKVAECGHRSFIMMSGFLNKIKVIPKYYSHEDITGVGYGICSYEPIDPYVMLARETINTYVKEKRIIELPKDLPEEFRNDKRAVFVSIHENGELRGCIGTIYPVYDCVGNEIISNAISAATKDPRFLPIEIEELDKLEIKVDVLTIPEEIDDIELLDPKKYGVIVKKDYKQGVLLPDLEGIDTVGEQIAIAKKKAGIPLEDDVLLKRFEVIRHYDNKN